VTRTAPGAGGRPLRRDAQANRERVLAAAMAAVLRAGRQVPMATIAAEAGVGVATLYRRYPTREALLDALTERSFRLVLAVAEQAAERPGPALAALGWFLDRTIEQRAELILPLHGGPTELSAATRDVQAEVHDAITRMLDRGRADGSLRDDLGTADVVIFGAMLAQPLTGVADWDDVARRQKELFLRGAAAVAGPGPTS
jgi:AcrR family transcriptional regulator